MAKQERAIATRKQIVESAAAMFDRHGYERASLTDIVEHSGLTKGALYFHFKTKEDLAAAVIGAQHAIAMDAVQAINGTGAPTLERIVMFSYELGRQMIEDPIVRAGIRLTLEMSASDGPPKPYLDWIETCEQMFHTAIAEGDALDIIGPADLARFYVAAFTGVQLVSNVLTQRADLEARIDQMLSVVLAAIVPPRRRHRIEQIRCVRWDPTAA